jgi:hypothetical protein
VQDILKVEVSIQEIDQRVSALRSAILKQQSDEQAAA